MYVWVVLCCVSHSLAWFLICKLSKFTRPIACSRVWWDCLPCAIVNSFVKIHESIGLCACSLRGMLHANLGFTRLCLFNVVAQFACFPTGLKQLHVSCVPCHLYMWVWRYWLSFCIGAWFVKSANWWKWVHVPCVACYMYVYALLCCVSHWLSWFKLQAFQIYWTICMFLALARLSPFLLL